MHIISSVTTVLPIINCENLNFAPFDDAAGYRPAVKTISSQQKPTLSNQKASWKNSTILEIMNSVSNY